MWVCLRWVWGRPLVLCGVCSFLLSCTHTRVRMWYDTRRQALVQMVERMEAQCREKRAAISRLKRCVWCVYV